MMYFGKADDNTDSTEGLNYVLRSHSQILPNIGA